MSRSRSTIRVKHINRLFLLATGPFLGAAIWLSAAGTDQQVTLSEAAYPQLEAAYTDVQDASDSRTAELQNRLVQAAALAAETADYIRRDAELYDRTTAEIDAIVKLAAAQKDKPYRIYDKRISRKLGTPIDQVQTNRLTAQLYRVKAQHFDGYAMKLKLKSKQAVKMVLGNDKLGGSETTLDAVKRTKAFAGINAGGFADSRGKRYPLSTTIIDGEYVTGFEASYKDLFFVGLNDRLQLIGGKFKSKDELDKLKPQLGASFVPVLLKNGSAQTIPDKWATSPRRAPRTVIGNYKDEQLLVLVTDGYNTAGSSGATLEELQILLKRYGVRDAYNLDGGGSSSLVWDGRVINKPADGKLRKVPTNLLFYK